MQNPKNDEPVPPESLAALQRRFAGHIRDPDHTPAPEGIEDRRMAIYRRLFFGNLRNLFAKNFPVLRRLLDDDQWDALIRDFMRDHRASTPMFTEIGREFVRFIEEQQPRNLPPFALELVHWEFLETLARLHEADLDAIEADREGDLLDRPPVVNPTLHLGQYRWPVHEIGPDFRPDTPLEQPIVLAACRKRNDRVGFLSINAVTARLIGLMQENPGCTGRNQLNTIAAELGSEDPEAVVTAGAHMLERLRKSELVLGSR